MIDPAAIRTHCDIVFRDPPPDTNIALRGLPEKSGGKVRPYLVWVAAETAPAIRNRTIFRFVVECSNRGLAAYCVPGFVVGLRAGNSDVSHIRVLVVDIDSGDIAAKVSRAVSVLGEPSLAVWSGGIVDGQRKQHLLWSLSGDISAANVTKLWGMVARAFGGDKSFDVGRAHQPLRIGGSLHKKAEPVVVEIASTSSNVLDVTEALRRLEVYAPPVAGGRGHNHGPLFDDSNRPAPVIADGTANPLGLARAVPMEELPARFVGHGEADINRFEAMTRMMGMFLSNIHDVNDAEECERNFAYFRQWAVTHIANIERDYDLRQHWHGLMRRERWKRTQPRRPRRPPPRSR